MQHVSSRWVRVQSWSMTHCPASVSHPCMVERIDGLRPDTNVRNPSGTAHDLTVCPGSSLARVERPKEPTARHAGAQS